MTENAWNMDPLLDRLKDLVRSEGDHLTGVPRLTVHRRNSPTEPLHCIYTLSVAYIGQGSKRVMLDSQSIRVEAGDAMLTALDLPVVSHVTGATAQAPFLALLYQLDAQAILSTAAELGLDHPPRTNAYPVISRTRASAPLRDAFLRLLRLTEEPQLVSQLAPGLDKEIIVRLLTGLHGPQLLNMLAVGSPSERVGKAVAWLKKNFTQAVEIDDLAQRVHMSPSTFRRHFKTVTGCTPLQYQKRMRLQEARHLMLTEHRSASTAGREVGYASATQFSREYRRLFGAPPREDVERLRSG